MLTPGRRVHDAHVYATCTPATCTPSAQVDEDRKPQIEASIVRIMKMRKEMEHNALISEARSHPRSHPRSTPEITPEIDARDHTPTADRVPRR